MEEMTKYETHTPIDLIKSAVADESIPVEKMQALFDLETQWKERESKKAFAQAIAKFQQECPIIEKKDNAHGKMYARMDRIWREIRPLIKECGLAIVWESCIIDKERNMCVLDGALYHTEGHSKPIHSEIAIPESLQQYVVEAASAVDFDLLAPEVAS